MSKEAAVLIALVVVVLLTVATKQEWLSTLGKILTIVGSLANGVPICSALPAIVTSDEAMIVDVARPFAVSKLRFLMISSGFSGEQAVNFETRQFGTWHENRSEFVMHMVRYGRKQLGSKKS